MTEQAEVEECQRKVTAALDVLMQGNLNVLALKHQVIVAHRAALRADHLQKKYDLPAQNLAPIHHWAEMCRDVYWQGLWKPLTTVQTHHLQQFVEWGRKRGVPVFKMVHQAVDAIEMALGDLENDDKATMAQTYNDPHDSVPDVVSCIMRNFIAGSIPLAQAQKKLTSLRRLVRLLDLPANSLN